MSSKEKIYIFILLGITILVVFIRLSPQPIDWSEGYSNEEKNPRGVYL